MVFSALVWAAEGSVAPLVAAMAGVLWFLAYRLWKLRNHEYRAEVTDTFVRWWEDGKERRTDLEAVGKITLEANLRTVTITLNDGRELKSTEGFPDAQALFDALRLRFEGQMFWGDSEQPRR